MFKKQYVPMFTPPTLKRRTNAEHKVISKRDEERMNNVLKEQHEVREMLNRSLEYRNSFLRSQRIMNYQAEKARLLAYESRVINNIRFYAPPVKISEFANSQNRLEQIERQMNEDLAGDGLFGERTRYY